MGISLATVGLPAVDVAAALLAAMVWAASDVTRFGTSTVVAAGTIPLGTVRPATVLTVLLVELDRWALITQALGSCPASPSLVLALELLGLV